MAHGSGEATALSGATRSGAQSSGTIESRHPGGVSGPFAATWIGVAATARPPTIRPCRAQQLKATRQRCADRIGAHP